MLRSAGLLMKRAEIIQETAAGGCEHPVMKTLKQFLSLFTARPTKPGILSIVLHINRNSLIAVSKISDKAAGVGAKYKLTVADEKLNITLGKVTMAGNVVSVPYNITGGAEYATQISAIVTDGTWTDKGWSKDAALKQYKKIADVNGTSGTCSFSLAGNISGELGKDYHIYIIAEAVNAEGETDYASVPVEAGGNSIPAVTAPVAKTGLIASDTAQALVTAGKANYGEMLYALGTDDKTAPTDGWSKEVPIAKEAGTYYVWYKVVGDADHEDTAPACVKVTIAEKEQPKEEKPDDKKEDDKPEEVITDPVTEKQEKVSEPVKETINDVPISANLAVSYPKAVEWTGKKITKAQLEALLAEGEVLTKLNISGLEEALKGNMKEGTDISKLFSYSLTISKDKDAGATGYFTVKVKLNSKAVKKAKIKGADKKALSQLVKDLNEKLKDTRFEYKIAALNLAEAESVSIKAKLKNGTLQLDEQGGLKGLKSVKVKIKIKGVKKAKTFTYSAKKAAKVFTIKITDAAAKTAELTALEGTGFTGTKSGISITK